MALRKIFTVPDPVLKKKAKNVTKFDDELQTLIDDMVDTMREAPGVGLAAPQIGVLERVIVVEYYENEEAAEISENEQVLKKRLYTVVNPEITRSSQETEPGIEGCLSIPGLVGEVDRNLQITVKAQNRHGQPITLKLKDWTARIFQHEIDHLNGVLFTDRTDNVWEPEEEFQDNV